MCNTSKTLLKVFLMSGLILQFGCGGYGVKSNTDTSAPAIYDFSYDKAAIPKAKPWTSENFKNNPDNFQFAILGDRGGEAR